MPLSQSEFDYWDTKDGSKELTPKWSSVFQCMRWYVYIYAQISKCKKKHTNLK